MDETAELPDGNEVKEVKVDKSGISGIEIRSNEVGRDRCGGGEGKESEVDDFEIESNEM